MKRESGFTLIEIIVTLLIVGIMATVAGLGIVTAVKGYMLAKNNAVIADKAQVAQARITRELMDLTSVTIANPSSIVFNEIEAGGNTDTVALGQSGTQILIKKGNLGTTPDYTTGDVLTDQVNAGGLRFTYYQCYTGSTPTVWTTANNSSLLSMIVVSLNMSGGGGGSNVNFSTTVSPRNNGNFGCAAAPTQENQPPAAAGRGYGCFVATAAYGNPYHPMVLLLKQFRDQYLAKWPGGRALIQFYYKEGPYLAAMIQDKPWACALARVLLLPFVGLAFLLVYAQGSIPLVILMIIFSIWLIKRYPVRLLFMKKSTATHDERGSVLIGLIVTMVIMALLGAAMLSLISTSGINQAYGVEAQKAYYLAESGMRYAGSQFLDVTDSNNNGNNDEQNSMASSMNGRTLTMTEGTIKLQLTPFHYAASANAAVGATSLVVKFPGGTPASFAVPSTGYIQITTQYRANATANYQTYTNNYQYTAFAGSTFTLSSGLVHTVPAWTSVTVLAQPSSAQAITPNSDLTQTTNRLTLNKPAAGSFLPQYNGEFTISGDPNHYVYRYAYMNHFGDSSTTTTLYGVSITRKNTDGTEIHTLINVTTASPYSIIPKDYFTIVSTGSLGNVSRTLTFTSPVDLMTSLDTSNVKTTSADSFTSGVNPGDATSNWYSASAGAFSVANISGGAKSDSTSGTAALQLTDQSTYGGGGFWWSSPTNFFSLVAMKWTSTFANFSGSWLGNGDTLSYDAQVKMYLPQQDHYMAGMVFRLNLVDASPFTNSSWLGVSFVLSGNTSTDYIPMPIPFTGIPMIILWQKPAGQSVATGIQWMAYRFIAPQIYFNGGNGTLTNGTSTSYIRGGTSGARAQMTTIGTSDSGVTGELVVNSSNLYSTFTSGEPLYILTQQTDITALVNGSVSLPATSLKIDTGKDTTTPYTGIQVNDIIVDSNGASARVTAIPAWTGNWHPNNNAAGTLTIAETQGASFTNNDTLTVYRPSASSSATFVFKDDLTDVLTAGTTGLKIWSTLLLRIAESTAAGAPFSGSDVNDIRIYVGDTAAHGSPTGSPLDTFRYADLRWSNPPVTGQPDQCKNDIQWPPDAGWSLDLSPYLCQNGTTYADYFTLVQGWVINSGADGSGTGNVSDYYKLTGTTEEPNSTIRTNKFTTNSLSSFTQQEIGLQVSGSNMATSGTYFDDFAVRLSGFAVSESNGFSNPLQY